MRHIAAFASLLLLVGFVDVGGALGQTSAARVRGDVVSVRGAVLQLKADDGQSVTVKLADRYTVSARSRADPSQITSGIFLGATAVPGPDGILIASEVHIFPESMRGTGEGHRPMDAAAGTTMTNATVASVAAGGAPSRTMTNATVTSVAGSEERRITVKYAGGEKVITIPRTTPIAMMEPGDASLLVPGAHVVVSGARQNDGSLLADRIAVGKNGFVPPL